MSDTDFADQEMTAALGPLRAAAQANPQSAIALADLGSAAANLGGFDEAILAFQEALALDSAMPVSLINLGAIFGHLGNYEEARRNFERAVAFEQIYPEVHSNLGHVLQELGELEPALKACRRALELDPANGDAAFNLHGLIYDEQNMEPAVQALEAALKANPVDDRTCLLLGVLYDDTGHPDKAEKLFSKLSVDEAGYHPGLDTWRYVKMHRGPNTRLFAPTAATLRYGLEQAALDGLVLEFGVRFGTTLRIIAAAAGQSVHGFDSFQGLPENWHAEPAGSYSTQDARPQMPDRVTLHEGWFEETLPAFLVAHLEPVRFLHIDCDLYSSAATIFRFLGPRIQVGSIIVFDDYFLNPHWRDDEFKAFQEAVDEYGWQYEYIAFSLYAKQAAVRIISA
ncbi:MAG: tetratricopeptide repeat protein [Rhodospirillales bacterium]